MIKRIFHITILLAINFNAKLFAQTPSYHHFETSNGLMSNEIFDMMQDKQGILWLGTGAGLVQYDGYRFTLFSNEKSRSNAISYLNCDKQGRIWCCNFSGQVFYCEKDSLHLFQPFEKRYATGFVELCIDAANNLYITNQNNKLYQYNLNNFKEKEALHYYNNVTNPFAFKDGSILFTLLDSSGVYKLFQNNPITSVAVVSNQKHRFLNKVIFSNSKNKEKVYAFQRYNTENPMPVLYNYENGFLSENALSNILKQYKYYPQVVYDDDGGNVFIGTENGLALLQKNKEQYYSVNFFLQGNNITSILQDTEGTYWIGTAKNGLYKIANIYCRSYNLTNIHTQSNNISLLATNHVNQVVAANSSGEIFRINTQKNSLDKFLPAEHRDVQTLFYNAFSNEYFITYTGTYKLNNDSRQLQHNSALVVNAKDFFQAGKGLLFSVTGNPQCVFRKDNIYAQNFLQSNFPNYNPAYGINEDALTKRIVLAQQNGRAIFFDEPQKILWVGFVDGLCYYENKKPVKIFDSNSGQPITAVQILQSANGDLLIASLKQGVYVIRNKKIIKHYSIANVLASNQIKKIRINNNKLWLIAGSKLQCLNIETDKIVQVFSEEDGLLSNDINDIAILHDTVYVASSKGLQYFAQNVFKPDDIAPLCLIKKLTADDSLCSLSNIMLPYGVKNIAVYLQGVSLKSNGNFIYKYRLMPGDTNWINVNSSQNIIRYTALTYGNYTFQCKVCNANGIESKVVNIGFGIKKPWWLQWWFIILMIVFVFIIVYTIYMVNLKREQKQLKADVEKLKIEEELRRSQLTSLKAQMNPHFMFNALNSIQEFIILNDKQQANMYMGKFADLMRMTLDMSSKDEVSLEDELKTLNLYFELEALRFEDRFNYEIIVAENIQAANIFLPSMLIQPYIENAIKHGLMHKTGIKKITVRFQLLDDDTLLCKITDNGVGRKRSAEINAMRNKRHTSFATGATQVRLDLLNTKRVSAISVKYIDLADVSGLSSGTEVILEIPVN